MTGDLPDNSLGMVELSYPAETPQDLSPLDQINDISFEYAESFFGRPLSPEEAGEALGLVLEGRTSALRLHAGWTATLDTIEESESPFADAERMANLIRSGSLDLRRLKTLVAYADHLERECRRLVDEDEGQSKVAAMAGNARRGIALAADAMATDISGYQSLLTFLLLDEQRRLMSDQGTLIGHMQASARAANRLTGVIAFLTVLALVVGVLTLVIGG